MKAPIAQLTATELALHVIVWHIVHEGSVRGASLAAEFERHIQWAETNDERNQFTRLAQIARAAGRPYLVTETIEESVAD